MKNKLSSRNRNILKKDSKSKNFFRDFSFITHSSALQQLTPTNHNNQTLIKITSESESNNKKNWHCDNRGDYIASPAERIRVHCTYVVTALRNLFWDLLSHMWNFSLFISDINTKYYSNEIPFVLDDSSSRVSLEQADSHLSVNSGAKIFRESHLAIWNKLVKSKLVHALGHFHLSIAYCTTVSLRYQVVKICNKRPILLLLHQVY